MLIDMKRLLAGEVDGNRLKIDYTFKTDEREFPFDTEIDGVEQLGSIKVVGDIVDMGGYMRLRVSASLEYDTECARCLKPLHRELEVSFERTVIGEGSLENTPEDEADDYIEIVGGELDIEPSIVEELMMAFPTRELCSEECKGLCPKCGKNLNEGACNCVTKEIDPRLAVLKKLLDNQ